MPLVVHYLADLQSVHRLRCYGNIMEMRGTVAEPSGNAPGPPHACRTRTLRMPAKTSLAGDTIDAPAACAVPIRPYCGGVVTRRRNVSEYAVVLALCLVCCCPQPRVTVCANPMMVWSHGTVDVLFCSVCPTVIDFDYCCAQCTSTFFVLYANL